jgi:hypothetical protein
MTSALKQRGADHVVTTLAEARELLLRLQAVGAAGTESPALRQAV